MLDHVPGAHRTTALMPAAANDAVELALSDYAVDDRIVRALSLAVHDVVARLVAIREAERGAASFEAPLQYRFGAFALDVAECKLVIPAGRTLRLPGLEYRLLRAFVEQPRRVLSRGALAVMARRDGTSYPSERTIAVYIARLRKRLAASGGEALISTVRHGGYVFEADVVRA